MEIRGTCHDLVVIWNDAVVILSCGTCSFFVCLSCERSVSLGKTVERVIDNEPLTGEFFKSWSPAPMHSKECIAEPATL